MKSAMISLSRTAKPGTAWMRRLVCPPAAAIARHWARPPDGARLCWAGLGSRLAGLRLGCFS